MLLLLPKDGHKSSTAEVYAEFDRRGGEAGFDDRAAALRAIVDFARNFGRKSSTARASWSRTTFFAHLRPVSCRCRATFLCTFAVCRFASR